MIVTASTAVPAGGLTFRPLGEEDGREYLAVQRRALGHSRCGPNARTPAGGGPRVVGALAPGGLPVALAGSLPMTVRIGGREVPAHGLLDVAVALRRRGRGVVRRLLARLLADERASGSAVSLVHPAAPVLYRCLGYEVAGCLELREPARAAVKGAVPDPTVRLRGPRDGEDVLSPLSRHLEGALSPAPPADDGVHDVVLERAGEVVGMLRLERLPGRLVVHLLRAADAGAWATALAVLGAEAAEAGEAGEASGAGEPRIEVWGGGGDDLIRWSPGRPQVRECSMPMLRVVDVVRALEGRGWPDDVEGRWHLDVTDSLLPDNTGTWVLALEGGRARVSAGEAGGAPVSPPRLAQLVAGVLPAVDETVPADLVRASLLRPWAGLVEF